MTIRHVLQAMRSEYRWALRSQVLESSTVPLYEYRVAKEARPAPRAEFSAEEFARVLGALNPARAGQWRVWGVLALCGYQGARQHAVRHLRWADVGPDSITWRSEWDKQGRTWEQPLRAPTRAVLEVLRSKSGAGEWVFPAPRSGREPVVGLQTIWWGLRQASAHAGVPWVRGRGAHGLRRMLAGDVLAATGDPALALHAIGDTDLRQARSYLRARDERVREAFAALDGAATNTETKGAMPDE